MLVRAFLGLYMLCVVVPVLASATDVEVILGADPFDKRRGYQPPKPVATKSSGPVLPPLNAAGVMGFISLGDLPQVLIKSSGKVKRVPLNGKLGEWRMEEVKPDSVVFAYGEHRRTIRLIKSAGSSAGSAVAVANRSSSTSVNRAASSGNRSPKGAPKSGTLFKSGTYGAGNPPPEGYKLINTPFGQMLRKE